MDGSAFDRLTKTLTEPRSRRGVGRLLGGLAVGGPLALLGGDESTAKRKKKVTLCHNGQTITVSQKAKKKHLKHGDTLDACPTSPPPPVCVPEPPETTCSAGCGNQLNDCDQTLYCPCPRGQNCLSNGTCARPCTEQGHCSGCTACPGCAFLVCSFNPNLEGERHCVSGSMSTTCASLAPCSSTAQCPRGFQCMACTESGQTTNRCAAVAECPRTSG